MRLRCHICAVALAGLASPVAASSLYGEYFESVVYRLEYFTAPWPWSVSVDQVWDESSNGPSGFEAQVGPDPGGYSAEAYATILLQFLASEENGLGSLSNLAGNLSDLAGKSIDLANLTNGEPGAGFGYPVFHVYWTKDGDGGEWSSEGISYFYAGGSYQNEEDSQLNLSGSLSFDNSGQVSEYGVVFSRQQADVATFLRSNPVSLLPFYVSEGEGWGTLLNPEVVDGLAVFDSIFFEQGTSIHTTRPGYWKVSATKECYIESRLFDEPVYTECRTAPPAPIPLPASLGLLFVAVGSLLGLRAGHGVRRRRQSA